MLKEAIEYLLLRYTTPRPSELVIGDGSGRRLLYDDRDDSYSPVERWNQRTRTVSNIESLSAMVIEEARRLQNGTGDWMTVVFSLKGAQFFVTDQDTRTVFGYDRKLSPQWCLLNENLGRGMPHRDFVRLLQALRPSIVDYRSILAQFRDISFGAGVTIQSSPLLVKGKGGFHYCLVLTAKSGETEAELPTEVKFEIQFARGSRARYEMTAEVDISLKEQGDKKAVEFALLVPDQAAIKEQAIADEVQWFKEQAKELTQLHILEDY